MRTESALSILESLRPGDEDIASEVGQRSDAAFLRVWLTSDPDRWAVIYTPGDRWFTFEVAGGFSLDHFEEDTPDDDVARLIDRYLELALRYLRHGASERTSRVLRLPSLVIVDGGGEVILRRSVARDIKSLLRFGSRR